MTHEDVCKCFRDDTLLAIQAPSGTQLEVPIPDAANRTVKFNVQSSYVYSFILLAHVITSMVMAWFVLCLHFL